MCVEKVGLAAAVAVDLRQYRDFSDNLRRHLTISWFSPVFQGKLTVIHLLKRTILYEYQTKRSQQLTSGFEIIF